ncbi:MAG TPA: hydroxyethylthiazole kinase [Spirochaetota bacterium]|jgi:hydroxyethylthiazole kinase|nr:hydroxyethylthiazole kinase [Spirochaetota bacterium]
MNVFFYLEEVRKKQPLVHHLTNWVTIYQCAQVVKSFGASPVMAHAQEEVCEMASIASALVLNIGTLTSDFIESMIKAATVANKREIPVVLDVCGAGATAFRDDMCFKILNTVKINIIKGNSSEIAKIAGEKVSTKGVDAGEVGADISLVAKELARRVNSLVVATGVNDVVTDGNKTFIVRNGHELMSHVVGTGCMATSVIGTFAGASPSNLLEAAAAGLCCFEIASEIAAQKGAGPGTYIPMLFDEIFKLEENSILRMKRIDS